MFQSTTSCELSWTLGFVFGNSAKKRQAVVFERLRQWYACEESVHGDIPTTPVKADAQLLNNTHSLLNLSSPEVDLAIDEVTSSVVSETPHLDAVPVSYGVS